ncbi:MAG: sigma 54-interacting transcriptional regulator, partial [Planctomycetota bacterium]
ARTVADSSATLLVLGESGTGKSMIARSVHELSPRVEGPFVELHCGSIPETLLESELFGHTKGSFTGADADKQGKFLAADGGTIFIDEINSASPALQLKLLRVLQDRCLEPIGSSQTIHVDVRVILATNQPLEPLVREGQFREDLYYRINVVQIELPPLRDRTADIPQLVEHFLKRFSTEHGRQVTRLTDEAMEALLRYPYPGNVRELQNIMERAVVLSRRPTIELSDLPESLVHGKAPRLRLTTDDEPWEPTSLGEALKEPERMIILRALEANNWNRQQTAEDLQINRTTLYKKMKTLGLDRIAG